MAVRSICLPLLLLLSAALAYPGESASQQHMRFMREWGGKGSEPGQFNMPIGIACTGDSIFVTDHYNDRIQHFDLDGKLLAHFSTLPNPSGIAADSDGTVYVTHFPATGPDMNKAGNGDFVTVYSREGTLMRQWGRRGTEDGEFNCPGGIALGADGRVYIADQTNHRVQVFDREGKFLLKWGRYGNEPGQFGGMDSEPARTGGPQFVALDAEGNVWTTEGMNCRIQQFSREGDFLASWGSSEDHPGALGGFFSWPDGTKGRLQGPIALCFDQQARLWISAVSSRVQLFTKAGEFLQVIGESPGNSPGQFYIPHGIALDSNGCLYIVDSMNHRVQKFEPVS